MQAVKFALYIFLFTLYISSIYSWAVPKDFPREEISIPKETSQVRALQTRGVNPTFDVKMAGGSPGNGETVATCEYWYTQTSGKVTAVTMSCSSKLNYCMIESYGYTGSDESPSFPSAYTTQNHGCTIGLQVTYPISATDYVIKFGLKVRKYNNVNVGGKLTSYRVDGSDLSYLKASPVPDGNVYQGNCVDKYHYITFGNIYHGCDAYSFQDPLIPVDYGNMSSINWLINQKFKGFLDSGVTKDDIQFAVWVMVHPTKPPTDIPSGRVTIVYELVAQALQHPDWAPTLGTDYDSIIVFCGETVQDTMYHVLRSTLIAFESLALPNTVESITIKGKVIDDCKFNGQTDEPFYPVAGQQVQLSKSGSIIATATTTSDGSYSFTVQVPSAGTSDSYLLTLINYILTPWAPSKVIGTLSSGSSYSYNFYLFDSNNDNNQDGIIDTCYCTITSQTDTTCDAKDDNCNGFFDEEYKPSTTTCGFGVCASTGTKTCQTGGKEVDSCKPDLTKISSDKNCDAIDNDCDGSIDEDYIAPTTNCGVGECKTTGKLICKIGGNLFDTCQPDTSKITTDNNCDGKDNDCDGETDEDYLPPTTTCGLGVCVNNGQLVCKPGGQLFDNCTPKISTLLDNNCNGIDEDCDGENDEHYIPPVTTCGLGVCATTGNLICETNGQTKDTCKPNDHLKSSDNNCDGIDNDCDGLIDEDYVGPVTTCGNGVCKGTGKLICVNAVIKNTCTPDWTKSSSDSNCDGIDNNCDGFIDNHFNGDRISCGFGVCKSSGVTKCVNSTISPICTPNSHLATADNNCDGIDNDCDGEIDEDYIPTETQCGFGTCKSKGLLKCVRGRLLDTCVPDTTKRSADNNCDGIDNDCNGFIDDSFPLSLIQCGTGVCTTTGIKRCINGVITDACTPLTSSLLDNNCDGIDNDCDGEIDEDYVPTTTTCGLGACQRTGKMICVNGALLNTCTPDLTKRSSDNNCDGIDNDCNGIADDSFAPQTTSCGTGICSRTGKTSCVSGSIVDSCKVGQPTSSNDNNCNGVDEDCDGEIDEDYTPVNINCGVGECANKGLKVCINGALVDQCTPFPATAFDHLCDGKDNDCDGEIDEDFQSTTTHCGIGGCSANGFTICQAGSIIDTCLGGSAYPEICDGIDNNCDGVIDEGYPIQTTCGVGACKVDGYQRCENGKLILDCTPLTPSPSDLLCDGIDNDCDGEIDEDYVSNVSFCGVGFCQRSGLKQCVNGVEIDSCSPGSPSSTLDDNCNGIDEDCDGETDEGFISSETTCGVGACASIGELTCVNGEEVDSCEVGSITGDDSTCNGIDDNCDGRIDENYVESTSHCSKGLCKATGEKSCDLITGEEIDSCVVIPTTLDGSDSCDGVDNDCDGELDEDFVASTVSCGVGACSNTGNTQCINGQVHEVCVPLSPLSPVDECDGIDNDCDGEVDEDHVDSVISCGLGVCNSVGVRRCVNGVLIDDCVAGSPTSSVDTKCDGLDNDCDGEVDEDYEPIPSTCGIGYCQSEGTLQCIDGAIENICTANSPESTDDLCDGIDNDCDGLIDEDFQSSSVSCGVGVCASTGDTSCVNGVLIDDCEAGSPSSSVDDQCDGLDNDCDGEVDEEYTQVPSTCGIGYCQSEGTLQCINGNIENICIENSPQSTDDLCDGIDNDCDGLIDEDFQSETVSCGLGVCASNGRTSCVNGVIIDDCVAGSPTSTVDKCDGLDNDCDGEVDEDYEPIPSTCGIGYCQAEGTFQCIDGTVKNICTAKPRITLTDLCDGIDNDCDGQVDEDFIIESISCGKGACARKGNRECVNGVLLENCEPGTPQSLLDYCDGIDNDCDGFIDEDFESQVTECGVGACKRTGLTHCIHHRVVDDCVIGSATSSIDNICDGIDNDCDGQIDEEYEEQITFCGIGGCHSEGKLQCIGGKEVNNCIEREPSADTNCDLIDNDCDGLIDEDYIPEEISCTVHCSIVGIVYCTATGLHDTCITPSTEDICDGEDNDCDGEIDEDSLPATSECGVGACKVTVDQLCVDGAYAPRCIPSTPQYELDLICDYIDNDCDGEVDEDFQGEVISCGVGECKVTTTSKCIDGVISQACTPLDPSSDIDNICDGLDNDCDGSIDEDFQYFPTTCGVGVCFSKGELICENGSIIDSCEPSSPLSSDDAVCDGIDSNCNGEVDEDYKGFEISCGVGVCKVVDHSQCVNGEIITTTCTPLDPSTDIDNICDGLDNDCDGDVDEDYKAFEISCGVGECATKGFRECIGGELIDVCTPLEPSTDIDDTCDGKDNDCDGEIDEDYVIISTDDYCDDYQCIHPLLVCVDGGIYRDCSFNDTDADGVPDNCDKCEGFDDSIDSDNDGVPDACDVCDGGDDKEDRNFNGIPDHCEPSICGLGVKCIPGKGCEPEEPLDCKSTYISTCALLHCEANGCVVDQYSPRYQLRHYFAITENNQYSIYHFESNNHGNNNNDGTNNGNNNNNNNNNSNNGNNNGNNSNNNNISKDNNGAVLLGTGNFNVSGTVWVGLAFNRKSNLLFGLDSQNTLHKISTFNAQITPMVTYNITGTPLDFTFHTDGSLWILSTTQNQYLIAQYSLLSSASINSITIDKQEDIEVVALTFDAYGYSIYAVTNVGSYYHITYVDSIVQVNEMCFGFKNLEAHKAFANGVAMTIDGNLYTGWSLDSDRIGYSQIYSRECITSSDLFYRMNITGSFVVYTAVENCLTGAANVATTGGAGSGAYPGSSTNYILESYATTGVVTAVAGGFLGICAIFGAIVALNSTKSKEEIPLDTLLEGSDANVVTNDNAIYLGGAGVFNNQLNG